jgi:hypothetical protein
MELVTKLLNKYPWLSLGEAKELVDTAIGIFYNLRYPCEPTASPETRPIDTFMDKRNVLWICDEIAQRNGFNSATGYRENGISLEFDGAWVSERLINSIKPIIGVI